MYGFQMPDLGDRIDEVTKEMKTARATREAEAAAKAEAERAEREKKEAAKEAQKQAKVAKQARVNAALQQQQGGKKVGDDISILRKFKLFIIVRSVFTDFYSFFNYVFGCKMNIVRLLKRTKIIILSTNLLNSLTILLFSGNTKEGRWKEEGRGKVGRGERFVRNGERMDLG